MIELVYPLDPAPLTGPEADASELLPVVDENGLVIGRAAREYCHSGEEQLLHPVVHLQIVDRYSRFFLQHRSRNKETFPNRWDVAVGGHVSYGEYYQEALFREAGEEIGRAHV